MKKVMSIVICVMMLTGMLTACGTASNEESSVQNTTSQQQTSDEATTTNEESTLDSSKSGGTKILVAYYSATGTTEAVAEKLAEQMGADLFEITPVDEYTNEDLDWTDDNSRVSVEHNNPDERHVELVTTEVENFADYDTVFIGYPIWWGIAAWPVDDFVTENDFTGKTVIPFCTSASSGLGESGELLAEMAGTGDWQEGQRFSGGTDDQEIIDWIEELGY